MEENIEQLKEEYSKLDLYYYSPKEELANTITHGMGIIAALILTIIMLIKSSTAFSYLTSIASGICLTYEYAVSTIYHGTNKNLKFKMNLRKLDYPSVNLNIMACGSALCFMYELIFGYIAYGICIIITITNGILCFKNFKKYRKLSVGCNFITGLVLLIAYIIDKIKVGVPEIASWLYLAGLLISLIGAIIFRIRKPYIHSVFHIFVLIGPILCMIANYYQLN